MNKIERTKNVYGFLWSKIKRGVPPCRWHFNDIQDLISDSIVKGKIGIDIGSGCGYDTYIMAVNNPLVKIVSLDISDGIYEAKKLTIGLKNAWFIKGSVLEMPIKDNTFDFAYSFGVLHHIINPDKGIKEITRVIKNGASVFLYFYEDHSGHRFKYLAIKIITVLRRITTIISPRILYVISFLISPFVICLFSIPSRIFKKIKVTKSLADKIPFNFGTHLFSLTGNLYDRLGAPIEHRFSKEEVFNLLSKNGFTNIKIERLKSKAGWVVWGIKND